MAKPILPVQHRLPPLSNPFLSPAVQPFPKRWSLVDHVEYRAARGNGLNYQIKRRYTVPIVDSMHIEAVFFLVLSGNMDPSLKE